MRLVSFTFFALFYLQIFAQVGINTTDPKSLLDIPASNAGTPTATDGILIPRISAFPATNPGADQNGMLVFLTTTVGSNTPGFYYWEQASTSWIPVGNNANTGWKTSGNAGTNPASNFIGTTDNQDLVFKRGNIDAGRITTNNLSFGVLALVNTNQFFNTAIGSFALQNNLSGSSNTSLGYFSLQENTTGSFNTAVGRNALADNTSASSNTAIGYFSMSINTIGAFNTALGRSTLAANTTGSSNVAIGSSAMLENISGSNNTVVGAAALASNTTGSNNVAFGANSMNENVTGSNNAAFGSFSLDANTTGTRNAAFGTSTLGANTTASDNSAFGYLALRTNTTGGFNSAFGSGALDANNDGNFNSAFGSSALGSNIDGSSNSAFGSGALFDNTSGSNNSAFGNASLNNNTSGSNNTAFGVGSLFNNTTGGTNAAFGSSALAANTTGIDNVGVGPSALSSNTTANNNVAVGRSALTSNQDGNGNTAVGRSSLSSNTSGSSNIALGINAVNSNTTGSSNIGIGSLSLDDNTTGSLNTAIGSLALGNTISGTNNIGIGTGALAANTTGNSNTGIGNNSDVGSVDLINATAIGNNAFVAASNSLVLGSISGVNSSSATVTVGIGTTTPLRRLHVVNTGNSGGTSNGNTGLLLESDENVYQHFLTPSTTEKGLLFGSEAASIEGGIIFNNSALNNGLLFRTGGNTNRMAITSTGDVGIGTLSPSRKLEISATDDVFARITSSDGNQAGLELLRTGSTGNDWRIWDVSGELDISRGLADLTTVISEYRMSSTAFTPTQDISKTLGTSGRKWISVHAFNGTIQTSDVREKENIRFLDEGLDKVMSLKPVSYNWINKDIDNHSTHLGFIAQELQKTLPEVVISNEWKQNKDDTKSWVPTERLGVNYAEIIPVLVKAIQEQQLQIEELKNQIKVLEKQ